MRVVRVGLSGLKITQVTVGTALTIGTESQATEYADALVGTAWDLGVRSFDTSNNYGNGMAEALLGKSLSRFPREDYVLATKGSWPIGPGTYHSGLSRKHILWALEESLSRLGVNYVDIYYAHRWDPDVPMGEVVRTFQSLIQSGRVRYWATSEWPLSALEECHRECDRLGAERPILEQFIYSYAINKADTNGVKAYCEASGVGLLGFSPLAQGLLTGKYAAGVPAGSRIAKSTLLGYDKTEKIYEQTKARVDRFVDLCNEWAVPHCRAALQWSMRRGVLPVLGASSPEQLRESLDGIEQPIAEEFWLALQELERPE